MSGTSVAEYGEEGVEGFKAGSGENKVFTMNILRYLCERFVDYLPFSVI